jgi:hypothetical protein
MIRYIQAPWFLWSVILFAVGQSADTQSTPTLVALEVLPPDLRLTGAQASQQLVVTGAFSDGSQRDWTRTVRYESLTPGVLNVDSDGVLRPVADGDGIVRVSGSDGTAVELPVAVRDTQAVRQVSFTNHLVPLFTRAGCNMGACHGAQHGKGGFKLSLFGGEPDIDFTSITKEAEGRRVALTSPESSLLLLKPTLTVAHGGGKRLEFGGDMYDSIITWMEQGCPGPTDKDPSVVRIELFPRERALREGDEQQITVRATYSDGLVEDITAKARLDSLNDAVATVSANGVIKAQGKGETAVMVRYLGHADAVRIAIPYATIVRYPDLPKYNFIDEYIISKWRKAGLLPSDLCSDSEFMRRAYLDAIGTLPKPQEIESFLADTDPEKRVKLVRSLLDRPEYVDWWTLKWADILRNNGTATGDKGMFAFHNWIRTAFRENRPLDTFVRQLITAQGSTFTDGPTNFYRVARNPQDLAETTAAVFLGVRLQCAKCHQHPFEKWSQDDYYSLAAFFARVGTKSSQEFGLFGGETVVRVQPTGEVSHPKNRKVMKPRPLDAQPIDDPVDRRRALADWLTHDNMMFARNVVNRYWGYLMGRGIVEAIDDMRATNPPSNPELLDALASDFISARYDLKHLLTMIMTSRAYQLSALPTPQNAADIDNRFFSRYTVKRLTAEQMLDAVNDATGTTEKFTAQGYFLPAGYRAIQLPDPRARSNFLDTFGRAQRQITCECERTGDPNIAQALHLMNGDLLNRKIADPNGRLAKFLSAQTPIPQIIDQFYLLTFSRPPTDEERRQAETLVGSQSPKESLQDLLWALLNSHEFMFNH